MTMFKLFNDCDRYETMMNNDRQCLIKQFNVKNSNPFGIFMMLLLLHCDFCSLQCSLVVLFSVSPLKADYKARSSSLTTQISTDAEITPRDSLAEPVDDVFLAKEQGTSGATPDKPTHKSLSCAELKERAEDHNKLIEAIHKQVCGLKFCLSIYSYKKLASHM